jgi:hypothetical protein
MPHLISSVANNSSTKIGIVTDSRITAFLFPIPVSFSFHASRLRSWFQQNHNSAGRCQLFYNFHGVYIKVLNPSGNCCDSMSLLLSSSVFVSYVSISIFVFDPNNNQLCSLLYLFRDEGYAFVVNPDGTNLF